MVDPSIENNHHAWTPYAYVYNNPILLIDPDGRDSLQRAKAIDKALEYVKKNNNGKGNSYELSAKGKPGDPVDCSGLVSESVEAGGETDPNRGSKNGVTNIAANTAKVDEDDVVPGNLVILNGSKHIGVIIKVERDKNGNVLNMSMVDSGGQPSSGKSGPRISNLITNGKEKYYGKRVDGYRKWDTKADSAPRTQNSVKSSPNGSPGIMTIIKNKISDFLNEFML